MKLLPKLPKQALQGVQISFNANGFSNLPEMIRQCFNLSKHTLEELSRERIDFKGKGIALIDFIIFMTLKIKFPLSILEDILSTSAMSIVASFDARSDLGPETLKLLNAVNSLGKFAST